MKTATKTTAKKPKKPRSLAAALRADRRAREAGEKAGRLTPEERREMLDMCRKMTAEHAPTMEAAGSDALVTLMAAGIEFCKKYYSDATEAHIHITRRVGRECTYSVHIPFNIPEPTADAEKGGAA